MAELFIDTVVAVGGLFTYYLITLSLTISEGNSVVLTPEQFA